MQNEAVSLSPCATAQGSEETGFYFSQYEDRRPPEPLKRSVLGEKIWQALAVLSLLLGARYIWWRWTGSLNWDAWWFALPLVVAESCAYFGLILFTLNLWKTHDYPMRAAPARIDECVAGDIADPRPITVDVFIATYNEEEELVRLSIRDAKAMRYPHPVDRRGKGTPVAG